MGANSDETRIIPERLGGKRQRGQIGTADCSTGHIERQDGVAHGHQLVRGLPGQGTGAGRLAENITAMISGRLAIKVYSRSLATPWVSCWNRVRKSSDGSNSGRMNLMARWIESSR